MSQFIKRNVNICCDIFYNLLNFYREDSYIYTLAHNSNASIDTYENKIVNK